MVETEGMDGMRMNALRIHATVVFMRLCRLHVCRPHVCVCLCLHVICLVFFLQYDIVIFCLLCRFQSFSGRVRLSLVSVSPCLSLLLLRLHHIVDLLHTGLVGVVGQQPVAQPLHCVHTHRLDLAQLHTAGHQQVVN